ncbi:tripartite tricarboxylate transporter substrate binding protein [Clostridium sp. DL1XJH146]
MFSKKIIWILSVILLFSLVGCNGIQVNYNSSENDIEIIQPQQQEEKAEFPCKPIQIVVPYAAGGGTDAVARAIADSAEKKFCKSIAIVNTIGESGEEGISEGIKSEPDGYTVTMITSELITLPNLGLANFSYEDFIPILQLNADPAALTVRADSPWQTIEEFLQYAKSHPNEVKTGNSGMGAIWNLAAKNIENETQVQLTHVPFDGGAPAAIALLGGDIDVVTISPAEVIYHVNNDKLKILGVMADERLDSLPDVPTFKEEGVDLSIGTWRGLAVPKGTPDEVVKILEDGFTKAAEDPEFKEILEKLNLGYKVSNSNDFRETIKEYDEFIKELVKKINQ